MKRKILAIILATVMLFSISTIAFAADNNPATASSEIVPFGDNFPTQLANLPYYSVHSRFSNYNYTAKRVPPTDNGILWSSLCFKYEGTGSVKITVSLYKYNSSNSATYIDSYSFNASRITYNTHKWTGLNSSNTYFIRVSKTGSSSGVMRIGLGANESSASNYTFNY